MPDDVAKALGSTLKGAYDDRPPFQRNDYLRWIKQAKTDETRAKRIDQMLEELRSGDRYMGQPWKGKG